MFHLVLQVRKGRERARPESIQFILQEHNFLFLLLDNIEQLPVLACLVELLLTEVLRIAVGVALEPLNLHPLLHRVLELPRFALELLVLNHLLFDLLPQLRDHGLDRFDPRFAVLDQACLLRV